MLAFFKAVPGHTWVLIGAIACLLTYHFAAVESMKLRTQAADKIEFAAQIEAMNQKAKDDHDALQAKVDAAANTDNATLAAKLDALKTSFTQIKARYAPTKALPVDCLFDDGRLQSANSALSQ